MTILLYIILFLVLAITTSTAAVLRLRAVLNPTRNKPLRHGRNNPNEPAHILIVLGSGGHTTEMISMLTRAVTSPDPRERMHWPDFRHRTWVVGEGDSISAARAQEFEDMVARSSADSSRGKGGSKASNAGTWDVVTVPRARRIHQPLYTAPFSSLRCLLACWSVLAKHVSSTRDGHASRAGERDFPDLILCNGPATATILVFASLLLRFVNFRGCETRSRMRTVYVESWARVKRPSLSGRLLSVVVDRFLVQWAQLDGFAGRAEFRGVLV